MVGMLSIGNSRPNRFSPASKYCGDGNVSRAMKRPGQIDLLPVQRGEFQRERLASGRKSSRSFADNGSFAGRSRAGCPDGAEHIRLQSKPGPAGWHSLQEPHVGNLEIGHRASEIRHGQTAQRQAAAAMPDEK
jgi:hypothetical protein